MGAGPLLLPSLNMHPVYYRPHGAGDWSGHVPFGYDLVAEFRPPVIVELGTYYGESYFTFCQAVEEHAAGCKAFAVDTWRGDAHTGIYGEAVFREALAHNKRYEAFSTLLRMTFDEAAARFEDGSIDLLHIDGLHTYEAVRHDFETWFPKVAPGGVILLHDTQARSYGFGVWRFWQDARNRFDNFEFFHCSGLGVIRKPGGGQVCGLSDLLFASPQISERVRRFYQVCGERLEYRDRLLRLGRNGNWDLLAKFYWKPPAEAFSEQRSLHLREAIDDSPKWVRFDLPEEAVFAQVRIDLMESPQFLRLSGLRLRGPQEQELWRLPANGISESFRAGVEITQEHGGGCLVALSDAAEHSIVVNIPQDVLAITAQVRNVELELCGVAAEQYAAAVAAMLREFQARAADAEARLASGAPAQSDVDRRA